MRLMLFVVLAGGSMVSGRLHGIPSWGGEEAKGERKTVTTITSKK